MASFELLSSNHDGHIKALHKAILMASRISKEALLEFSTDKMRLCARTDLLLVKFTFGRSFFNDYKCDRKHRCFVHLKALSMPFKSSILIGTDGNLRPNPIRVKCSVEDELNNRLVFRVGTFREKENDDKQDADPMMEHVAGTSHADKLFSTQLCYRLNINDLDSDKMSTLDAINRTIDYARVEISPKGTKREKFLLSAFSNFAPDIDQVTIKSSASEVKFIGSTSPLNRMSRSSSLATSEFKHPKEDFSTYNIKEDVNITVPLKCLKLFLNFVETTKIQTFPKYVFEGVGLPAHFIYDATFYKAHFISSTPVEYIPEIGIDQPLPIEYGEPNESFIEDENVIQAEEDNNYYGLSDAYHEENFDNDLDADNFDEEEDAYNDNQSDCSEHMDGNLENIRPSLASSTPFHLQSTNMNLTNNNNNHSIAGTEFSIRSEMRSNVQFDPEKVREVFDLDQDPDEIERRDCYYSSDEE